MTILCVTYHEITFVHHTSSILFAEILYYCCSWYFKQESQDATFVSPLNSSIFWLLTVAHFTYLLLFNFLFCTDQHLLIKSLYSINLCSSTVTLKYCTVLPTTSRKIRCVLILQLSLYQQDLTLLSWKHSTLKILLGPQSRHLILQSWERTYAHWGLWKAMTETTLALDHK